jgi:hypothetical protein
MQSEMTKSKEQKSEVLSWNLDHNMRGSPAWKDCEEEERKE